MRYRILLQVAVHHKPKDNPDADFMRLGATPLNDLLYEAMDTIKYDFKLKEVHKLADGSPHMVEFEAITDINPEIPPSQCAGEEMK